MLLKVVQLLLLFAGTALAGMNKTGTLCTVTPTGGKDDTPDIMAAFKQCGQNGQIELVEGDYTIAKVMVRCKSTMKLILLTRSRTGKI